MSLYLMPIYYHVVPYPLVSVTAPNNQTVGQSLTLQCEVTTVRGITSRVDIAWRRSGNKINTTRAEAHVIGNLLMYRASFTILQLKTSDNGANYGCRLVIYTSPRVTATDTVKLDITGEYSKVCMSSMFLHTYSTYPGNDITSYSYDITFIIMIIG